jgi:hypothetical protein
MDNKDVGEEIRQAILASKGMIASTMGQKAAEAAAPVEAE